MRNSILSLLSQLRNLISIAPNLNVSIPEEVIDYVQEGRNPDIYTREFVELVMKLNQMHKGKTEAFGKFRDVLAREFVGALPEMEGPVKRVVESSGGSIGG
jgi:mediator of RNA polymerase II transcription subunit 10